MEDLREFIKSGNYEIFDLVQKINAKILIKEFCIVGGGSAGTYCAMNLHDKNKSYVLIEDDDILGGNAKTYYDPLTGTPCNTGVIVLANNPVTQEYLDRLNVAYVPADFSGGNPPMYFDFDTGESVNYTAPDPSAGLGQLFSIISGYAGVEYGYDLPDPVPEDLYIPFGDFLTKYNLENLADIFQTSLQNANAFKNSTMYVIATLGLASGIFFNGFYHIASGDVYEIYQKAGNILGDNVITSSEILFTKRTNALFNFMVVSTPDGYKIILFKKLIVAHQPLLSELNYLDLDTAEKNLLGKLSSDNYVVNIIKAQGVPDNTRIINRPLNGFNNVPTDSPCFFELTPTPIANNYDLKYYDSQNQKISQQDVQNAVIDLINRLNTNGGLNIDLQEFPYYSNHYPQNITVSIDDVKNGFYKNLRNHQGYRNTYYINATTISHNSGIIWRAAKQMLNEFF